MTGIPLSQIRPNDWNPNEMTQEESAELVAELKHLGRVPKPIVLRQNGGDYEIIDGEQTYKAMLELGWTELQPGWYEVAEFDDFEAMRQTYKRNQHGTHHKVKEGRLFVRMIAERGLSQSALAREMEVSEGTVRNALEYVKALEPRNGYEAEFLGRWSGEGRIPVADVIASLSVRQVRELNELPIVLGDAWLRSGADPKDLHESYERMLHDEFLPLIAPMRPDSLDKAAVMLFQLREGLRLWGRVSFRQDRRTGRKKRQWIGGWHLQAEDALPYYEAWQARTRWKKKDEWIAVSFIQDMFEAISRPDGSHWAKIILPVGRVKAWLEYPEPMSLPDFCSRLQRETDAIAGPVAELYAMWREQVEAYAPEEIKALPFHDGDKYGLWQEMRIAKEEGWNEGYIQQALQTVLPGLLEKAKARHDDDGRQEQVSADRVFRAALDELGVTLDRQETLRSFGDKKAMLELVLDRMKLLAAVWGLSEKGRHKGEVVKAFAPMIERLAAVPEPELALLCAMLLHRDDYWEIWARALGWKFDAAAPAIEVEATAAASGNMDSHTRSEEVGP